jgi:hypothetical protein
VEEVRRKREDGRRKMEEIKAYPQSEQEQYSQNLQ